MSKLTIYAGGRQYTVKPTISQQEGYPFLELGPGGTSTTVSCVVVQFAPQIGFDGQFVVMGRPFGPASNALGIPFVPIPYRRISLGNLAQQYELVTDPIIGNALIQIPSNGLSIALLVAAPTAGSCDIAMWDLQGPSAI